MKRVCVFILLAMVMIGSCAAQSTSNDAQRLVGTWSLISGSGPDNDPSYTAFVFNANGTGTYTERGGNVVNFYWGISATGDISTTQGDFKFFLSPDGRRMVRNRYAYQKN
jgi:hypothetical protein